MLATAFDPLAAARDLKAAGFGQDQAEALAAQLRFAAGADHADLATKADLAGLRADLKAEIADLRADLDTYRAETKAEIAGLRAETKAEIAGLRADLDSYRAETKADIADLRTETKAEIAGLRADLYRLLWIQGGAIVAILGALQFLPTGTG